MCQDKAFVSAKCRYLSQEFYGPRNDRKLCHIVRYSSHFEAPSDLDHIIIGFGLVSINILIEARTCITAHISSIDVTFHGVILGIAFHDHCKYYILFFLTTVTPT